MGRGKDGLSTSPKAIRAAAAQKAGTMQGAGHKPTFSNAPTFPTQKGSAPMADPPKGVGTSDKFGGGGMGKGKKQGAFLGGAK